MSLSKGKVMTARGMVAPEVLGRVMMHEHLHADLYDWKNDRLVVAEEGVKPAHRELIFRDGIPNIRRCNEYGCHAFVDASPAPWRGCPEFYVEAAEAAAMHIILSTGAYREVEAGTYYVKRPEDAIWPYLRQASLEELADFFTQEIVEGINGTGIRAGVIKLGSSGPSFTPTEEKCFRAGGLAQKRTGVHITTHCTKLGAETTQLRIFAEEDVDLRRVVIGHTAGHLMNAECRKVCLDWMRRGANFLPTNLNVSNNGGEGWRPLVEAIHEVFDAGLGSHLCLGLDCAFVSQSGPMRYDNMPPPPWLYMFTHTLPAFRKMGLTEEEEDRIMRNNPQRIIPVQ